MWQAARFWLDLGVDGFRLDAIGTIYEDPKLTPHEVPYDLAGLRRASELARTPKQKERVGKYWGEMFKHQWGQPGLHALMKELRAILDEYPGDRMLVGEDDDVAYMGNGNDELQLVFNFPLMRTEGITPAHIRRNQRERLARLAALPVPGWGCNTLGNHDSSRTYTRYGDGQHNAELARLNLALVLTLRGTPFLYNGEEIGMSDLPIDDPSRLRDTMATWYHDVLIGDLKVSPEEAAVRAGAMTRDKNRTPMQWSNAPHGGFCPPGVEPWLPVHPDFARGVNVEDQQSDPASLLNYYRRLLRLRRATPALVSGDYRPLAVRSTEHFTFLRSTKEQAVLVALNYTSAARTLHLKNMPGAKARVLFSSAERGQGEVKPSNLRLGPFEVLITEIYN
jgi:alpha-glucosidase